MSQFLKIMTRFYLGAIKLNNQFWWLTVAFCGKLPDQSWY